MKEIIEKQKELIGLFIKWIQNFDKRNTQECSLIENRISILESKLAVLETKAKDELIN